MGAVLPTSVPLCKIKVGRKWVNKMKIILAIACFLIAILSTTFGHYLIMRGEDEDTKAFVYAGFGLHFGSLCITLLGAYVSGVFA